MFGDLTTNLIASAIFTLVLWMAGRYLLPHRRRFLQERTKISYYRILRFAARDRGDRAFYSRVHHSLDPADKQSVQDVFDEVWSLNAAAYKFPEIPEPISLVSRCGTVDAIQILPVVARNADNHPITRQSATSFTAQWEEKTTRLIATGTLINGIQAKEDWWFGTMAQYNGQALILVIDFSSLAFGRAAIRNLRAVVEREKREVSKESLKGSFFEEKIADDIYIVRYQDAKRHDALKVMFDIDIEKVPRFQS